jgi:hypothetical protein
MAEQIRLSGLLPCFVDLRSFIRLTVEYTVKSSSKLFFATPIYL